MSKYTLKDLLIICNGKDYKKNKDGNIPIYGSGGIIGYSAEHIYDGESILLPRKGTLDNIQYVNGKFWTIDTTYWTKINQNIVNPKYLYLHLKLLNLAKRNTGSTLPSMTFDTYYSLEIELPNLDEQRKVSNYIFDIINKININNETISELENLVKIIYDYWFLQYEFPNNDGNAYKSSNGKFYWNDELKKEIPEEWKVKKIEDFCQVFTGKKDVNQSLDSGKYKFYSCSPNYRYSNDLLYEGKAILISGNGSYTGRTIFVDDAFDLYQRTYACVEKENNDLLVYIYYTMLKFFTPIVSGGTHGSAIPYIVYDDIAKQKILYNEDIVNKFIIKVNPMQEMIIKLNKENEELNNLKNYLLPLLMNGQVGFKN